jgi:hypothetical protein
MRLLATLEFALGHTFKSVHACVHALTLLPAVFVAGPYGSFLITNKERKTTFLHMLILRRMVRVVEIRIHIVLYYLVT